MINHIQKHVHVLIGLLAGMAPAFGGLGCSRKSPPPEPAPLPPPVVMPPPAPAGKTLGASYSILLIRPGASIPTSGQAPLPTGEKFRLGITLPRDSFVYLLSHNASGSYTPLFPNPRIAGGNNQIRAGLPVTIPPEAPGVVQSYQLLPPPTGQVPPYFERFVLIVSDRRQEQLDRLFMGSPMSPGQVQQLVNDLKVNSERGGSLQVTPQADRVDLMLNTPNTDAALVHEIKLEHSPALRP